MEYIRSLCNFATTGFSSEIGTKLRDWAIGQAGGSCYSRASLSSNDSETLYTFQGGSDIAWQHDQHDDDDRKGKHSGVGIGTGSDQFHLSE